MWIDLKRHILEEFAAFSACSRAGMNRDFYYRLRVVERSEPRDRWALAKQRANKHRRLMRARTVIAAVRPPCPHCSGPVIRLGTTGTPPRYCSEKCMRAAKFKRWYDSHVRRAA